mgnify:CR=1 FL=1
MHLQMVLQCTPTYGKLTCGWIVRRIMESQPSKVQVLVPAFVSEIFRIFDDARSLREDIPINLQGVFGHFVNLKMICRLNLSEVLIGIGCVCS